MSDFTKDIRDLTKQIKDLVKILKKEVEKGASSSTSQSTTVSSGKATPDLAEQIAKMDKILEQKVKNVELYGDQIDQEKALLSAIQERASNLERIQNKLLKNGELSEENEKILQKQIQGTKEFQTATEAQLKALEKAKSEHEQLAEAVRSNTENLITSFTGIQASSQGFLSSMLKMTRETGSFKEAMSVAWKQTKDQLFSLGNIATSMLQKVQEATIALAIAQEQSLSDFKRSTGAAKDYENRIISVYEEQQRFGVNTEEAAEAMTNLYREVDAFRTLSEDAQVELAGYVAQLQEIGISSQVIGQAMQTMTSSMGMSVAEMKGFSQDLVDLGTALNSPEEAVNAFNATKGTLLKYGKDFERVFKEMAYSSRALGVSIGSLVEITEGMETFEDAATSAAKLNQLLGGNLVNSTDLLLAEGPEKIRMLIQAMEMSGKSWDNLNRFHQRAIADAAGLSHNMDEAASIFRQTTAEYDKNVAATKAMADASDDVSDRAKDYQSVMEQLKTLMMQFAISMKPVIDFMSDMLQLVIDLNEDMGGNLIPILTGIVVVIALLTTWMKVGAAVMGVYNTALAITGTTAPVAAKGMEAAGKSAGNASKGMAKAAVIALAFGAAVLLIGTGIWLAAEGLAAFVAEVDNLKNVGAGEVLLFLAEFSVGLILFGPAASIAGVGAIILGAGLLVLAGGLALANLAMGVTTELFDVLIDQTEGLEEFGKVLGSFSGQFMKLALGGLLLGLASPAILIGMTALAVGFAELAASLAIISTDDLEAIATIFESMAEMGERDVDFGSLSEGLDDFVDSIEGLKNFRSSIVNAVEGFQMNSVIDDLDMLADAMDNLISKGAKFKAVMEPLTGAIGQVQQLTEEKVQLFERFADATGQIIHEASVATAGNIERVLDGIGDSFKKFVEAQSASSQKEIVLELDKDVLTRFIINFFEENKKTILSTRR